MRRHQHGQSTMEFAILIAVALAAFLGLQIYVKRAVEGRGKQAADQIGEQWSTAKSDYAINVTSTGTRKETLGTDGVSSSTITADEVQTRNANSLNVNEDVTGNLFN